MVGVAAGRNAESENSPNIHLYVRPMSHNSFDSQLPWLVAWDTRYRGKWCISLEKNLVIAGVKQEGRGSRLKLHHGEGPSLPQHRYLEIPPTYSSLAIFFFSVPNESIEVNMRRTCGRLRFLFYFFILRFKVGTAEREEGDDDRRKKNLLVKVGPVRRRERVYRLDRSSDTLLGLQGELNSIIPIWKGLRCVVNHARHHL